MNNDIIFMWNEGYKEIIPAKNLTRQARLFYDPSCENRRNGFISVVALLLMNLCTPISYIIGKIQNVNV